MVASCASLFIRVKVQRDCFLRGGQFPDESGQLRRQITWHFQLSAKPPTDRDWDIRLCVSKADQMNHQTEAMYPNKSAAMTLRASTAITQGSY